MGYFPLGVNTIFKRVRQIKRPLHRRIPTLSVDVIVFAFLDFFIALNADGQLFIIQRKINFLLLDSRHFGFNGVGRFGISDVNFKGIESNVYKILKINRKNTLFLLRCRACIGGGFSFCACVLWV